jgi:hypothetical protein
VNILKFDNETAGRAREMALEGLSFFIGDIHSSLKTRIKKMAKNGEDELPRRVQVSFARKLEEVYQMAMAFRLMDDVEVAYEAMREAIVAQIGAKVARDADGQREARAAGVDRGVRNRLDDYFPRVKEEKPPLPPEGGGGGDPDPDPYPFPAETSNFGCLKAMVILFAVAMVCQMAIKIVEMCLREFVR